MDFRGRFAEGNGHGGRERNKLERGRGRERERGTPELVPMQRK